jgi:hypothetical protein
MLILKSIIKLFFKSVDEFAPFKSEKLFAQAIKIYLDVYIKKGCCNSLSMLKMR